jgi:hypothetical protein
MKIPRVIVVGMNPSDKHYGGDKISPTFKNLDRWMREMGIELFSFINTVPLRGAATLQNVQWQEVKLATQGYTKVIALGNFASDVLRKLEIDHYKLPHPSPRNRVLNDTKKIETELRSCREYIES